MRISLFVIVLLCLGSCSAQPPPDPPMPTFTLTVPSYSPPALPPAVTRPLDASVYRTRICDIVTNEQATALGFPGPPDQSEAPQFISCIRENKEEPHIQLALLYSTPELFRKVYNKSVGPLDNTKLVTIAGQPALQLGSPVLNGAVPYCTTVLGLADDQAIQIDVNLYGDRPGACDRATQVAEAIVHNLGG